jgi:hypothetical protein
VEFADARVALSHARHGKPHVRGRQLRLAPADTRAGGGEAGSRALGDESRSNSASVAKMPKTSLPATVVVSICQWRRKISPEVARRETPSYDRSALAIKRRPPESGLGRKRYRNESPRPFLVATFARLPSLAARYFPTLWRMATLADIAGALRLEPFG